ncbi:unnamed protein product [Hermetia illucens]|uniref:Upstream activation factor subunit spp27 n=1 Tax=Hermetia illucens TaxID=343691 RepID=A0A7R8YW97_HERIL|nr:protein TRI1 [Hermetia illucens]CAD7084615.1 unnamed protein product [Hermetia illucens]
MSEVTKEQLQKEISDILKDADLASMSTKKVREQLEKTFKCDLNSRRQEIKEIVMDIVNSKESNEEDGSASESESEEEEEPAPKSKKRASTARKASPAKKKKKASSEEEDGSEADGNSDDNDSDYDAKPKKAAKGRKKGGRRKKGSDSDSDEDWKQTKKPKKAKGAGGGKGRGTGFTRPYTLSADLASVVGAESLPRYEVVKKIWSLIKERNLYDPKNKQYAICDPELLKIFGVKRFRTFSMLKYLKPHFID